MKFIRNKTLDTYDVTDEDRKYRMGNIKLNKFIKEWEFIPDPEEEFTALQLQKITNFIKNKAEKSEGKQWKKNLKIGITDKNENMPMAKLMWGRFGHG